MRKRLLEILGIIVTIILIMQNACVFAVSEKEQLQNQQKDINNQIKDYEKKIDEIESQKSETMKTVEDLIGKISESKSEINLLEAKIKDLQAQIKSKERDIQQKEIEYTEQEKLLDKRLIAMSETGKTTYLDVFLTATSFTDMISKYSFASELVECDKQLIQDTKDQKAQIEKEKAELESDKKELDTSLAQSEQKNIELKKLKSEKESYASKLTEDEKKLEQQIEELKNHESSIKARIVELQKEYDRQNSNKNGSSNASTGFGWPVKNNTIGTKYGVAGKYWSSGYHTGVDFPVSQGTQVYAVGDGIVCDTGYNKSYGNFVEIYHGNNIYSFYAHASSVQVKQNQKVSKGDPIMLSGKTGNVTGPHLHFEIRTPGYTYSNCVNPMKYLP